MSIPTKITLTGNHTLTSLQVSGSVDIIPINLIMATILTDIKFCINKQSNNLLVFQLTVRSYGLH